MTGNDRDPVYIRHILECIDGLSNMSGGAANVFLLTP